MTNQSGLERADDFARSDLHNSEMESTLKHEKGKEGYKAVLEYSWENQANLDSLKT